MTVLAQPVLQDADGSQEVMPMHHHQVDVVGVLATAETGDEKGTQLN